VRCAARRRRSAQCPPRSHGRQRTGSPFADFRRTADSPSHRQDVLLLCEHPPTYTAGRAYKFSPLELAKLAGVHAATFEVSYLSHKINKLVRPRPPTHFNSKCAAVAARRQRYFPRPWPACRLPDHRLEAQAGAAQAIHLFCAVLNSCFPAAEPALLREPA
jgi:hypothetical protein